MPCKRRRAAVTAAARSVQMMVMQHAARPTTHTRTVAPKKGTVGTGNSGALSKRPARYLGRSVAQ